MTTTPWRAIWGFVGLWIAAFAFTARAEQPTADLASMDLQQLLQVNISDPVRPASANNTELPSLEELAVRNLPGHEGLGKLVVGYHYRYVRNEGYRQGRHELADDQVLGLYPVVPVEITQEASVISVGWLANENLSFQATVPFLRQSTYHLSSRVPPFTLESDGIGDISLEAHAAWTGPNGARTYFGLGVGLPTGSIEAKGDTPRGKNSQLPYAMQLGSGTFDLKPSIGWSKFVGSNGAAGVDLSSAIRLGTNDRDYSLGNRYELDLWYSHDVTDWLRLRPELDVMWWGEIDGQDPEVTLGIAPVGDPFNYGGWRIDAGLTAQIDLPGDNQHGRFVELAAKTPILQDLNGTQIGTEWVYSVGLQFRF